MAIWGANYVDVDGLIIVDHGSYTLQEVIAGNVDLYSEMGSTCKTTIKDLEENKLTIDGNNVTTIGKLDNFIPRGFIIKDQVVTNKV